MEETLAPVFSQLWRLLGYFTASTEADKQPDRRNRMASRAHDDARLTGAASLLRQRVAHAGPGLLVEKAGNGCEGAT